MARGEKKEKEQRKQDKIRRFVYLSSLRSPTKLTKYPFTISSPSLTKQLMSTPSSTMDVSSYSPSNSQLNLGSSHTIQQLANSVSPLYYKLTPNDFTTFRIRNEIMCALDESIGIALLFTLQRLERHIVDAGHYRILDHIPTSSANLRSVQFDELNLPRPSVLLVSEFRNQHNPLFSLRACRTYKPCMLLSNLWGAKRWIGYPLQRPGLPRYAQHAAGISKTNSLDPLSTPLRVAGLIDELDLSLPKAIVSTQNASLQNNTLTQINHSR